MLEGLGAFVDSIPSAFLKNWLFWEKEKTCRNELLSVYGLLLFLLSLRFYKEPKQKKNSGRNILEIDMLLLQNKNKENTTQVSPKELFLVLQ